MVRLYKQKSFYLGFLSLFSCKHGIGLANGLNFLSIFKSCHQAHGLLLRAYYHNAEYSQKEQRFVQVKSCTVISLLFLFLGLLFSTHATSEPYRMPVGSPIGQILSETPENQWVRLNLNDFKDVWTPLDQRPAPVEAPSVGSPHSILVAWSSMAWDSNRGNLIFWGGGHANYPGNEVYRWNASTLNWERSSLPTEVEYVPVTNTNYGFSFAPVDGHFNSPVSAHTYDNSEFFPIIDRFVTFGGAAFNTGHYFELTDGSRTGPYFWDPSKADPDKVGGTTGSNVNFNIYSDVLGGLMWSNRDNLEPVNGEVVPGSGPFINGATAYYEENGKDTLFIETIGNLYKYTVNDINDPSNDLYELVGRALVTFAGQGAGAYDPDHNLFVRTSGSQFVYWNLDSPGQNNYNKFINPIVSNGTFDFNKLIDYGMDYDPVRKEFVLWGGESDVWVLTPPADLQLGSWNLSKIATNSVEFPTRSGIGFTGILGKWKYIQALDVFLGSFDPQTGDIWAFKPQGWDPIPTDDLPPYITSPVEGDFHWSENDLAITAVLDDADNSISKVEFFYGNTKIGEAFSAPYSTIWVNPPAGNHAVTAVATDNGILTTSIPINIVISNTDPVIQTKVLQQGLNNYIGTTDTYLYQVHHDINFSSHVDLIDHRGSSNHVSLLHFDIFQSEGGTIPDGTFIESATLSLYKWSAYDHVYQAYPLLVDWKEAEVTWDERQTGLPWNGKGASVVGLDISTSADAEAFVTWNPQWLDIDVTTSVRGINDGVANYGWQLHSISGNPNTKKYHSSEYTGNLSLRPMLTMEYRVIDIGVPSVNLTSPNDGDIYALGDDVILTANANDTDGSISLVEFYQGTTKLGEDASAPYSFTWISPPSGNYTLTAVVTDDSNLSTTSSLISIQVIDASNTPPIVDLTAPFDGDTYTIGEDVSITAVASDTDGSISLVEFYQGSTKLGEDASAPYNLTWISPSTGNYTLTAVATDDNGSSVTSSAVAITVGNGNTSFLTTVLQDDLDGYTGTQDAYLYEYHHQYNFGANSQLIDSGKHVSLLRFDIFQSEGGIVPDGAIIESATLSVYKSSAYDHTYQAYPILQNWLETEVTWDESQAGLPWNSGGAGTVGLDIAIGLDAEAYVGWDPQWLDIDVTTSVQEISAGVDNYGWKLFSISGNGNTKKFYSSEHATDPSLRPMLTVEYHVN